MNGNGQISTTTVRVSADLALEPAAAFEALVEELAAALAGQAMDFEKVKRDE